MPNNIENDISLAILIRNIVYQCNVKCCNISLLNYFSIVEKKRKRNVNTILIFWPKYNRDKNENKPYVTDKSIEDIESSERMRDAEQNSGRKTLKRKKKTPKSLTCIENASSNQWKTLKQKSKVLEAGSAEEPSWYTNEGDASTQEWKSILVAALQLDSNGAGWKAGRKGNNGYNPRKLFIVQWRKA